MSTAHRLKIGMRKGDLAGSTVIAAGVRFFLFFFLGGGGGGGVASRHRLCPPQTLTHVMSVSAAL